MNKSQSIYSNSLKRLHSLASAVTINSILIPSRTSKLIQFHKHFLGIPQCETQCWALGVLWWWQQWQWRWWSPWWRAYYAPSRVLSSQMYPSQEVLIATLWSRSNPIVQKWKLRHTGHSLCPPEAQGGESQALSFLSVPCFSHSSVKVPARRLS